MSQEPEIALATGQAIGSMFKALKKQGIVSLLIMFHSDTDAMEVICSETNDPNQVKIMAKTALESMREPSQLPDVPAKIVWQQ